MYNIKDELSSSSQMSFVCLPKILFTDGYSHISNDAKILYAFMLDRKQLSAKNGWKNENDEEYIYFTVDNVRKLLNIGKNKSIGLYKELELVGLIVRDKSQQGHADRITIKKPEDMTGLENGPVDSKNSTDRFGYQTPQVYKTNPNNTEYNNTELYSSSFDPEVEVPIPSNTSDEDRIVTEITSNSVDIGKERHIHAYLTEKIDMKSLRLLEDDEESRMELNAFVDIVVKELAIKLRALSSIESSGKKYMYTSLVESYDEHIDPKELKDKLDDLSSQGKLTDWIYKCYICWNDILKNKSMKGDPIRCKKKYFKKYFQSFLDGEYEFEQIDVHMTDDKSCKDKSKNFYDPRELDAFLMREYLEA